jgi:RNA polymerase-binding transcription factor DksA
MEKRIRAPKRPKSRAATQDVLGVAAHPARIDPKWQKHYQRLTELREHLVNRRSELTNDALGEQPAFSTHMADAGTDTYDRDFALGILSSDQDAIYEIEEAIDRISRGTYGICELTKKPIEPARLAAVPWARFSAAAERKLEKEGAVKHARLGPRATVPREPAAREPQEG